MFSVGHQSGPVDDAGRLASVLEFLIKELVDIPANVVVDYKSDGGRTVSLNVSADKTDLGKIIGKHGRIIKALRQIMSAIAAKSKQRVSITVLD